MRPDLSTVKPREAVALDPKRLFSPRQKRDIFAKARGHCDLCGVRITGRWIAGHVIPHAIGGRTEVSNGRCECLSCGEITHPEDTSTAAKCKRMARLTGRQKPGRKVAKIKSRGFPSADERARAKQWKEARVRG